MAIEGKRNSDQRLVAAYEAIDAGTVEILSLDIFDTLLWRKIPEPTDLFFLLGKRLKEEGWLIPAVTAESFKELRIEAERLARLETEYTQNRAEVTLPEIYWKLQGLFVKISTEQMLEGVKGVYESDVSEVIKIEVALEKELIAIDANILNLLFYARDRKIPIILVSDTYFEEPHILYLLGDASASIDKLYLSCKLGCDKKNGLFATLVKELHTSPHKILHIGDNYKSDILPALKEGIKAIHYPKYDVALEEILDREWTENPYKRGELLDPKQGDFGITALRAKLAHHVALKNISKDEQFFWKYGAMVLGPILFGFVHWIYDRCREMKEPRVFCLMREGKLYASLIRHFASYYPEHTIEAKQLWVSRVFMAHASMASVSDRQWIDAIQVLLKQFTLGDFCAYVGLDIRKLQKWSKYEHVMLEDPYLQKQWIAYLACHASLRDQILQSAACKRARFLKYLSGLTDLSTDAQLPLVDIGWSGTLQGSMQYILQLAHSPIQLHGLYLGTTQATQQALLQGQIREGYLLKAGYPYENVHLKGCFVLEQTATAETGMGSLLDIDDNGSLVTAPLSISKKQKKRAHCVQEGIFAFFDYMGPYLKSGAISWNSKSDGLQNQLRSLFLRSMVNATGQESLKFGSWLHDHGPTSQFTRAIAKDSYYESFIKDMLPQAAFKENDLNWPAAYAARHSKYLTHVTQVASLKDLPLRCFLSEDNFSLHIFLDTGKGFPKKASRHVDLRSNSNRSFYTLQKIFSSKKSIERIQLKLSFPSSLVRIKSLRFVAYDRKMPHPQQLTFFESEASHSLECSAKKQIDFNTFYSDEHLRLTYSFASPYTYQIKIKLCCEMFKMGDLSYST